mmetsp:Transcript_36837/g.83365  ORF Transcript_36837/g.83365 Transcript_36837/m.83365 type:complete len:207 (-) Transcript_36837:821-1441(-)
MVGSRRRVRFALCSICCRLTCMSCSTFRANWTKRRVASARRASCSPSSTLSSRAGQFVTSSPRTCWSTVRATRSLPTLAARHISLRDDSCLLAPPLTCRHKLALALVVERVTGGLLAFSSSKCCLHTLRLTTPLTTPLTTTLHVPTAAVGAMLREQSGVWLRTVAKRRFQATPIPLACWRVRVSSLQLRLRPPLTKRRVLRLMDLG